MLRKRNGKWHWRFQVDHRIWSGSTNLRGTKQDRPAAQKMEAEAYEMVLRGQNPNHRLVVRPFSEAADDFLMWAVMEHKAHPNTARRLATSFVSLKALFGNMPVGAISEGDIEDFKTKRRDNGIRDVTVRHYCHALSKFFQYAIKHRWAARNPVRSVKLPSDKDAVRIHVLTDAEEKKYFQFAAGDLCDLARLMLNQGCRPDELLSLHQADVDLLNRKLHIRSGKTPAARRTLTLTQESTRILAKRLTGGEWVFPSAKRPGLHITRLNNSHDAVLKKTGLSFVLYDLRHTFATRLAQAGIGLATLAAILGHDGLRIVERYVHPTQDHQDAAMLKYDAAQAEKARSSFGPVVQ
jgi:integrase